MSEYWVSHKKYFCKYCNIYIADDAPSRRQHESGLRHKGNVERFVRGLYKAGEKRKQDLEEEKREMARVEKAAQAAYAQDVGAGLVKPGSSSTAVGPSTTSAGPKTAAPKPSDPYANYTTAEFLGFTDPDEERRKAEAARRQQEGVAGEWEVVDVVSPSAASEQQEGESDITHDAAPSTSAAPRAGEKRPAEQFPDEEDTRGWKLRRKVANVGLGELYDPGALPIKLKVKKEEPEGDEKIKATTCSSGAIGSSGGLSSLGGTEKPKWSARGWNKPGTSSRSTVTPEPTGPATPGDHQNMGVSDHSVKAEELSLPDSLRNEPVKTLIENPPPTTVKAEEVPLSVKSEIAEPDMPQPATSGGSLFKKRKVPVAGGSRGGRRL
ncbi:hypothetical protein GY45DRAFT_1317474 [Cubamyces sp. BRFM 1775]|nr:hypothetical protein GY45DRAFT_1317474 [Cubamyces sp. BRFM 1775]